MYYFVPRSLVVRILVFLFLFPFLSHAYIDPGTGSYFLQVLLGFLLGMALMTKTFWRFLWKKIKSIFTFFRKGKGVVADEKEKDGKIGE